MYHNSGQLTKHLTKYTFLAFVSKVEITDIVMNIVGIL